MNKEKTFHATEYDTGKFICKVQIKGNRKSFYGKTEEEATFKAKAWYDEQLQIIDDIKVEKIESLNDNNRDAIIEQLNKIGNLLQEKNLSTNNDDVYITVNEAKDYLRISQNQMYSLLHQPDFPRQKIGRTYRILLSELKDYMRKHRFSEIKS